MEHLVKRISWSLSKLVSWPGASLGPERQCLGTELNESWVDRPILVLTQRELVVGQSTGVRQEGRSMSHETTIRGFGTENRRLSCVSYWAMKAQLQMLCMWYAQPWREAEATVKKPTPSWTIRCLCSVVASDSRVEDGRDEPGGADTGRWLCRLIAVAQARDTMALSCTAEEGMEN